MKNLTTLMTAALAVTVVAASAPAFAKANHRANSQSASSASTDQSYGNPDRQWHGENSQMND
jgi:hypothetical protein